MRLSFGPERISTPPVNLPGLVPGQVRPPPGLATNPPENPRDLAAATWFAFVDEFHHQEDEALAGGSFESILDEHRFVLSALIKDGEQLVLAAKQGGVRPEAGFTLEDLEATVESLHVVFHAQHRNGNSRAEKDQIDKLFNVKRPGY
jgi:hypothetical protein